MFHEALANIKPGIEVRSRRVGGATYQVPVEVRPERAQALAIRWLITAARARSEKTMAGRLSGELMDASQNRGNAVKKREDTHRMAEANRAFSPLPLVIFIPISGDSRIRRLPTSLRNSLKWPAAIRSTAIAISASWRTSTPARRRRPSASFITPASPTRSAKCMKAPRRWTGWSRSKSAGSPSRPPRRPASGAPRRARAKSTASTSSTRPGHVDFTIEVERSLRVLDGAVACFDGVAGVEPQSETVWRQADKYGVPRMCFINKLDRTGANFEYCVQSIIDRLGAKPAVLYLPIGIEGGFKGLVDLVENRAIIWLDESLGAKFEYQDIPDDLKDKAAAGAHRPDRAGRRAGR